MSNLTEQSYNTPMTLTRRLAQKQTVIVVVAMTILTASFATIAADESDQPISIKLLYTFVGQRKTFNAAVLLKDQSIISILGDEGSVLSYGEVVLWDKKTRAPAKRIVKHDAFGTVALSPNGRYLAVASRNLYLIDIKDMKIVKTFGQRRKWAIESAFVNDGKSLLAYDEKGLELWDIESGKKSIPVQHPGPTYRINVNETKTVLATLGERNIVRVWNLDNWKLLSKFQAEKGTWRMALSRKGDLLYCKSLDEPPGQIWNTKSGKLVHTLQGGEELVFTAAFSPNGKILATGGVLGIIKLWDVKSGKLRKATQTKKLKAVTHLMFTHDGQQIIACVQDTGVQVWRLEVGKAKGK